MRARGKLYSFGLAALLLVQAISAPVAQAFVLAGPPDPAELNPDPGTGAIDNNIVNAGTGEPFGLGGPKDIKQFFRWNIPQLTYSFDASFVSYFGLEGVMAVNEAFKAVNDYFVPADGSYSGVTQMDLAKHGFLGNYNTTWVNTTAQNAQIIDIKSLTLGMLVNHLGIGNPHRYAFSIVGATINSTSSQMNFHVKLRNYDPVTWKESDVINGVQYAYRLIHDGLPTVGALPAVTIADMEEFTADTSGNAWTAVAGITDAFYGETALYWSDQPTLFGFGVYYDGLNSMGGQTQPRHALTYDDAGGLKYLYRTNNYAWEAYDPAVQLVTPAQLLPTTTRQMQAINTQWSGTPMGTLFQTPTGTRAGMWPRRGAAGIIPAVPITSPLWGQPVLGWQGGTSMNVSNVGPETVVLRGGVDKIQFYHQPFDSLLGSIFTPTNFVWKDTFVAPNGFQVGNLGNTNTGAVVWSGQQLWQFGTRTLGRTVLDPDFLFVADNLGTSIDGVPIAYDRTGTNNWSNNAAMNIGYANWITAAAAGPGVINLDSPITYTFTKLSDHFEVIWSGESSLVGNQQRYSLWGHIRGPGPDDVVTFPKDATTWKLENAIAPDVEVPTIGMVSDDGGQTPIEQKTYTRTEEVLTINGNEMASATAVEILSGDIVLQTIWPVDNYIVSNQQIKIPPGVFNDSVEGSDRQVRVWNTVGPSLKSPQKFNVETGRPIITATAADGIVFDRALTLVIRGYGFRSKDVGATKLAFVRVDDNLGSAVFDNGNQLGGVSTGLPKAVTFEVLSDTMAVLPVDAVNFRADGYSRRIRVARKTVVAAQDVQSVLSPGTNPGIAAITSKPVISTLAQLSDLGAWVRIDGTNPPATSMFKRDRILEINGTALNTTTAIEIVKEDGTSFTNPVFIQLPNASVAVDDNGTSLRMGAEAITAADADSNSTVRRAFRFYNAAGKSDLNASLLFAVNTQPVITGIGGFKSTGAFNRDKTVGDDIAIFGSGLNAIAAISIHNANGTTLAPEPSIPLPHPGVSVTDTQILIDTQLVQFANGATADTTVSDLYRIFRLTSARDTASSPLAQRFNVGTPPGFTSLTGFAATPNYRRDFDTLAINGSALGMVTRVDIVDAAGIEIPGALGVTPTTGVTVTSSVLLSIAANAPGWSGVTSLFDSVTTAGRRIRVTTPFGVVTSTTSTVPDVGAITVSATPAYMGTTAATFAGGGFDGISTYSLAAGNLYINGLNFRGVKTVEFTDTAGAPVASGTVTVNANAPPAGYTFNANGTQIIINSSAIPAAWAGANRKIQLTSAANQATLSGDIVTVGP